MVILSPEEVQVRSIFITLSKPPAGFFWQLHANAAATSMRARISLGIR
jgi:hypothetical protein